jgi:chaperonin GroEL
VGKQVQFDDAARAALRRGVEKLAGAVRVTLGPRGRNVVIGRGAGGGPTITNDGFTVSGEIELADRFENMGAQMLREVAVKTGSVAGDGTTTATLLAQAIISRGLEAVAAGHNPVALKRGIDRSVAAVVEALRQQARPVGDPADLERVAAVSAGGDRGVGALVAEAMAQVGPGGVVTVEPGRGLETVLEVVEGVHLAEGYLSPYFVTEPETMEAVLENPLVMVADHRFTAVGELLPALEMAAAAGRPLLLFAEDVEGEALAMMVVNRLRGSVGSVALRAPATGERRRELLDDLALLTGARLYAADLGLEPERFRREDFGRASRVRVGHESATLIEGGGDPAQVRGRLELLRRELEASEREWERDRVRERIARLSARIGVLRAGGASELEIKERGSRLEDALAATRAAVAEGVVAGGGVALLRAQPAIEALGLGGEEREGAAIVSAALEEPARQIADNAGVDGVVVVDRIRGLSGGWGWNAETGEYEDLLAAGIMDPVRVTRSALQHAAGIGGLVLTTDVVVVDDEEEKGPPPAAGG